jgi:subtilase family serine protease
MVNVKLAKQRVHEMANGMFAATLTVRSTGSRTARDVPVRLTDGRRWVGHARVDRLAAGHTTTLRFTWRATPGRHTITGSVDPRNRIAESNEADNRRVTHVRAS